MYYIATYYWVERWSLEQYDSIDELQREVKRALAMGNTIKVFKELDISIGIS